MRAPPGVGGAPDAADASDEFDRAELRSRLNSGAVRKLASGELGRPGSLGKLGRGSGEVDESGDASGEGDMGAGAGDASGDGDVTRGEPGSVWLGIDLGDAGMGSSVSVGRGTSSVDKESDSRCECA